LAERGKILARISIEQQFVMNQLIGGVRVGFLLGKLVFRQWMRKKAAAENLLVKIGENLFLAVKRHSSFRLLMIQPTSADVLPASAIRARRFYACGFG